MRMIVKRGQMMSQSDIQKKIKQLKSDSDVARELAADALGNEGSAAKAAVPALVAALDDKCPSVRWSASAALLKIGDRSAVPGFIEALQRGKDKETRVRAAEALGRIGDKTAVPALREALTYKGTYVRKAVREALKKLEPKE